MHCAACALTVEQSLRTVPGVQSAEVNYANSSARITYDTEQCNSEAFQQALAGSGYALDLESGNRLERQEALRREEIRLLKRDTFIALAFSLPLIPCMFFMHIRYMHIIMMILSAPVVFWSGRSFIQRAWNGLKRSQTSMDTLVALSTLVAWSWSAFVVLFPMQAANLGADQMLYFESAALVVAFVLLGRLLESGARLKTFEALAGLSKLQPDRVLRKRNTEEELIPLESVVPGDLLIVKAGQRIGVDGIVTEGNSAVEESLISGESLPVPKEPGSRVYGGTLNTTGALVFRAEAVGSDTLIAQIARRVEEAQGSKAPVQLLVDKVSSVFVPVVIIIALLSAGVWLLFEPKMALQVFISVLVIACPCALGLATPTAVMVGIGKAASAGILVRDAAALEKLAEMKVLFLDKTGTLTEGRPEVTEWKAGSGWNEAEHAGILYAMQKRSSHPLSAVLASYVLKQFPKLWEDLLSIETEKGKGIKARLRGRFWYCGSLTWMRELGITADPALSAWAETQTGSMVCFSNGEQLLAAFALEDPLRPDASECVRELQAMGIELRLLSGDRKEAVSAAAKKLGISEWKAEVLPSQKAEEVKRLQQSGQICGMSGDGINDAEALSLADVGLAIGHGTDLAREVSGITLLGGALRQIPLAIHLSRASRRTLRQNLFWAFIYNLLGIPLAAGLLYPFTGQLLNPVFAGAAMALSSVSVVSNSLRLRYARTN
jgi:Cu2+-exporting ATPase